MSNIDEFYEKIATNEGLKKKLNQAEDSLIKDISSKKKDVIINKVIPLAKEYGFNFSYEEFKEYENMSTELSDEELMDVSGGLTVCLNVGAGKNCGCFLFGYGKSGCTCPMVGGGTN